MKTSFACGKSTKFPRRRPVTEKKLDEMLDYCSVRERFYKGFPSRGPSVNELARNGFIYNKAGDEVICVECRLQVKDLTNARMIASVHLQESPECSQADLNWHDDFVEGSDSSGSDSYKKPESEYRSVSSDSDGKAIDPPQDLPAEVRRGKRG